MLEEDILNAKEEETTIREKVYSNEIITQLDCEITACEFKESFLSEVKFKKISLTTVDFTSCDFFKTPLKSVDFSNCNIDSIMLSDQYSELRGVKINMFQAIEIAKLLGVKVVS